MSIMESIKEFISSCPHLPLYYNSFNVNYLDRDSNSYMIEESPGDPIVKTYINGDTIKKYNFVFASREIYSEDLNQNIQNSGFYEKLQDWIEECNNKNILPDLGDNKISQNIKVTTSAYLFDNELDRCQYQIQMCLTYFQKKT